MQKHRACVIDSLGLGIMCILYHCTMCARHHNLVSFVYAIPIFHILIFTAERWGKEEGKLINIHKSKHPETTSKEMAH